MRKTLPILLLTALAAGCLTRGTRHILYLDPGGSVTWTVLEEEVRSDEPDPVQRDREEQEWIDQVLRVDHDLARAFRLLGPRFVDARFVRQERPYAVVTEARFDSVAEVLEELLRSLGLRAEAELAREADRTTLTLTVAESELVTVEHPQEELLLRLLPDPHPYRFVLTEGRFVDAEGFELEEGGRVALLGAAEGEEVPHSEGEAMRYVLSWSSDPID